MRNNLKTLTLAVLILFFGIPAFADYQKGQDAYNKGDYAIALKEFRLLADQNYDKAQFYLGLMYDNGEGVPQNYTIAHMWLYIAASKPVRWNFTPHMGVYPDPAEIRDRYAKNMSPTEIATAQRLARECVAKNYKDC